MKAVDSWHRYRLWKKWLCGYRPFLYLVGGGGEEFFKSEGETVLEALNNLSLLTGREPFIPTIIWWCSAGNARKKGLTARWISLCATIIPAPR